GQTGAPAQVGTPAARPYLNRIASPLTIALVLLVLWVPLLVLVYFLWPRAQPPKAQLTYNGPSLVYEVRNVGELTTLRYEIQRVVAAKEKDFQVLNLPISTEQLSLIVYLTGDFSYDLTRLAPGDIKITGVAPQRVVTLKLPPPTLEVHLDTQKTVVFEHTSDLVRRLLDNNDPHFETWLRQVAVDETRVSLKNGDGPETARRNAEALLLGLFKQFGVKAVRIETQSRGPADRVRFEPEASAGPPAAPETP
ncbi:MAG: DUF4230 domain-containing protein, partial [Planctomycetota bacterium]